MDVQELLAKYRRIMDSIHAHGNIYYDAALLPLVKEQAVRPLREGEQGIACGRFDAYKVIAILASDMRSAHAKAVV